MRHVLRPSCVSSDAMQLRLTVPQGFPSFDSQLLEPSWKHLGLVRKCVSRCILGLTRGRSRGQGLCSCYTSCSHVPSSPITPAQAMCLLFLLHRLRPRVTCSHYTCPGHVAARYPDCADATQRLTRVWVSVLSERWRFDSNHLKVQKPH